MEKVGERWKKSEKDGKGEKDGKRQKKTERDRMRLKMEKTTRKD